MQKFTFLFTLLLTMPASATDAARCGTDAFGNTVCMDKDGVLTNAPAKSTAGRSGTETKGKGAAAGAKDESGTRSGDEEKNNRVRCGTDPFGNTVCRQF